MIAKHDHDASPYTVNRADDLALGHSPKSVISTKKSAISQTFVSELQPLSGLVTSPRDVSPLQ